MQLHRLSPGGGRFWLQGFPFFTAPCKLAGQCMHAVIFQRILRLPRHQVLQSLPLCHIWTAVSALHYPVLLRIYSFPSLIQQPLIQQPLIQQTPLPT